MYYYEYKKAEKKRRKLFIHWHGLIWKQYVAIYILKGGVVGKNIYIDSLEIV